MGGRHSLNSINLLYPSGGVGGLHSLIVLIYCIPQGAWEAYKICKYAYLVFPQFALGQGLMDMVSNTFMYKIFERYQT